MCRLINVPPGKVYASIDVGNGVGLLEYIQNCSALESLLPDCAIPMLYPSVKENSSIVNREASTVHDISTLLMPECHEDANIAYHLDGFDRQLSTDEVVFCISEATRAALIQAYPSVATKTRVLYQYVDWPQSFESMDRNQPSIKLGRYAVVVGTIEPRKNLGLLLKSLGTRELRRSTLRFVIIGSRGWKVDQFLSDLPPDVRTRLLFTGYVSEFTKYRLIKNAEFLIFPSLYEGFGIPALEAMSLGKPVLAARSSSLPEVIGDSGIYFDPLSVSEFASSFQAISHPLKLSELSPLARAASAAFTPARMAEPVTDWLTA
jgi:glycosyltransferase involved in cell wall biosynthesis